MPSFWRYGMRTIHVCGGLSGTSLLRICGSLKWFPFGTKAEPMAGSIRISYEQWHCCSIRTYSQCALFGLECLAIALLARNLRTKTLESCCTKHRPEVDITNVFKVQAKRCRKSGLFTSSWVFMYDNIWREDLVQKLVQWLYRHIQQCSKRNEDHILQYLITGNYIDFATKTVPFCLTHLRLWWCKAAAFHEAGASVDESRDMTIWKTIAAFAHNPSKLYSLPMFATVCLCTRWGCLLGRHVKIRPPPNVSRSLHHAALWPWRSRTRRKGSPAPP